MRSCVEEVFLGGGLHDFEFTRLQLITMLEGGLNFNSKVLDIGCDCLRVIGSYSFLYFGIKPNRDMLEVGVSYPTSRIS